MTALLHVCILIHSHANVALMYPVVIVQTLDCFLLHTS